MNQEEDYSSDSDQSDEDFCPDKAAGDAVVSEEDSDDAVSEEEQTDDVKVTKGAKKLVRKSKQRTKKNGAVDEDQERKQEVEAEQSSRRSTRQTDDGSANGKGSVEKDKLESDDEDKSRTDALWADFMSDVKPAASSNTKKTATTTSATKTATVPLKSNNVESAVTSATIQETTVEAPPKKITVTEILDFAGQEVRVEKLVDADSIKSTAPKTLRAVGRGGLPLGLKRTSSSGGSGGSGGLGSILNQIGKKSKLSVLEKTKLDWNSFKQHEGIDEQLQTHNKGKDGYLERQDFLQRTDLRQFEIEKSLRQTRRNN